VEVGRSTNDTFVYKAGYGQLDINEYTYQSPVGAILQLVGVSEANVIVTSDINGNVYLTDGTSGDRITIDGMENTNWFSTADYGVAQVTFSDGAVWGQQQILDMATTGTTGANTLYGAFSGDTFDGKGDAVSGTSDVEVGRSTNDTFVYKAGYGQLEIGEYTYQSPVGAVLQLFGVSEASVSVTSDTKGNVYLTDGTSGDQIKIDNMENSGWFTTPDYGVAEVTFADGTVWTRSTLLGKISNTVSQTKSSDNGSAAGQAVSASLGRPDSSNHATIAAVGGASAMAFMSAGQSSTASLNTASHADLSAVGYDGRPESDHAYLFPQEFRPGSYSDEQTMTTAAPLSGNIWEKAPMGISLVSSHSI
jgi:hypothetical protein